MKNKDILEIIERNKQYIENINKLQNLYNTIDELVKSSTGELQYNYINQKTTIGSILNDTKRQYEEWLESEVC